LGIERIAKWATAFGLGQKTGIDLPQESSGVMPSEEWKIKNFHQKWFPGETVSVGIGQGAVAVTPIQLARAIGAIASDGVLRRPHVAFPDQLPPYYRQVMDYNQESRVPMDEKNWEIITDAMANVPTPMGTAGSAHLEGIDFAGKTGSAQTMSNALAERLGHAHSMKDNAWFVGVTPRRNPSLVVAVLFEGGEHGQFAGRIAAQVVKAYVDKQRRLPVKVAGVSPSGPVEVAAVWNDPQGKEADDMQGGRFYVDVPRAALKHAKFQVSSFKFQRGLTTGH
jgi:penicillin-binding protein 2